jgi:hypothetical protein
MAQTWCCIFLVGFNPTYILTPTKSPLLQALAALFKTNTITNPEEDK